MARTPSNKARLQRKVDARVQHHPYFGEEESGAFHRTTMARKGPFGVWHSPTVLEVLALRSVLDTGKRTIRRARLFAWAEKSASCAFYLRQFLASLFRLDTAKNPLANQSPCGKSRKRARSTPAATKSRRESRKNQPVLIRVTSGSVHRRLTPPAPPHGTHQ